MRKTFCLIYIGYLIGYGFNDPVILCISDDKLKVKYYLKNVRNLSKTEYEIRKIALDFDTAMMLYEDYVLQDFEEDCLFLTNQDIEYVNKEIQCTIKRLEEGYFGFKEYYNLVQKVPSLKDDLNTLSLSLKVMENHLSKVKTLRKICTSEIKKSPIFSKNIIEYLQCIRYLQEDRELTELFYRKVNDE